MAGSGPEGELARRPAARARTDLAFEDQAPLEELSHSLRDDRPAETGSGDELRAGPGSAEANLVEDDHERIERLVGQGPADRCRTVVDHPPIIRPFYRSSSDFCT